MNSDEVTLLAQQAALMAERVPRVTREFFKLMAALRQRSTIMDTRFTTLYNNTSSSGNHMFSRAELQEFGLTMARLTEHGPALLPIPKKLEAGPLVELRKHLGDQQDVLATKMRVSENLLAMINSGRRRLDSRTAQSALGVALSLNIESQDRESLRRPVRDSLIKQLEYIAYEE